MKPSEMALLIDKIAPKDDDEVCGCEPEEADALYEDDDFWEAVDLLETCAKTMKAVLKYGAVGPARRRLMENLCDDIGVFVAEFIENDADDDTPEPEENEAVAYS